MKTENKQNHVSTETSVTMTSLMCNEMKHEVVKYDHIGQAQLIDANGIPEPAWMIELRRDNMVSYLIYETCTHYMYIASMLTYRLLPVSDTVYEKKNEEGRVLRRGKIVYDEKQGIAMRWEFF